MHDRRLVRASSEIEALTRTSAMKLDLQARTVKLSNKEEIGFGQALLATGANVRRLNVPGAELEGIHYLRTFGNADAIREDAAGKRVVLIGGSYIASEVAASLTELGSSCTMVMMEPVALSRTLRARGGGASSTTCSPSTGSSSTARTSSTASRAPTAGSPGS